MPSPPVVKSPEEGDEVLVEVSAVDVVVGLGLGVLVVAACVVDWVLVVATSVVDRVLVVALGGAAFAVEADLAVVRTVVILSVEEVARAAAA